MSKRAIIFDLDGTLIDSEPLHLKAYQQLLSKFGYTYQEHDNREFLGRTDHDVCSAIVSRLHLDLSAKQLVQLKEEILMQLMSASATPRPGVLNVLEAARRRDVDMAVASSATLPTIEYVIEALSVRSYFKTLASGDEVTHGKPAPDVFLLAADRLKVAAENCLVIEDTLNGIRAAKAAGMACLAVPCDATLHQDHSEADARLQSLEQFDVARWIDDGIV